MQLTDKRVLLIGGSTGIGRETARLFGEEGARLVIMARNAGPLAEAAELAGGADTIAGDVTAAADLDRAFALADERLGGLDALVVCAALGVGPLAETPEEEWRYVVDTNLTASLAAVQRALPRLRAAGGGQVILVGSISPGIKAPGESVYAATKGGLKAFADTLRKEVAEDRIRITLVEPGATATDMQQCDGVEKARLVAEGRMLDAVEIAEAVVFAATRRPTCNVMRLRLEPLLQRFA